LAAESEEGADVFDSMDGRFQARLKGLRTMTKSFAGTAGPIEATTNYAILEAKFDLKVLDRLHEPSFVAIERSTASGPSYMVYEVFNVAPMHFQMLGVSASVPQQIREEFLDRVSESWGGSDETWIDISAVPTGYKMAIDRGRPQFERSRLIPLYGSRAHVLSDMAVKEFLCVKDGLKIGDVSGLKIGLEVDPEALIRYHIGIFGFTGVGKSNLTANLLRKLMERDPSLRVCIIDVSGEYPVHLADKLSFGRLYSTEDYGEDVRILAQSQVVPETLEARLNDQGWLVGMLQGLKAQGRIKVVDLSETMTTWTLQKVYEVLSSIAEDKKTGYLAAEHCLDELRKHFMSKGIPRRTELLNLSREDVEFIIGQLNDLKGKMHEKSGALKDIEEAVEIITTLTSEKAEPSTDHRRPEDVAKDLLSGEDRLFIVYAPDPDEARSFVARFLGRLLYLKKVYGYRQKVLVVLDEAQEFAPGDARGPYEDSSKAVEALLRQGRKYRAFALISTQRVARLNTNALQQLHSYFVSTLPRSYDRMVIAESFSLDYSVLEKTSQLSTGEWLFVSYKATRQKNVPVFIRAENNEDAVYEFIRTSNAT
jgi:hypothetical protein